MEEAWSSFDTEPPKRLMVLLKEEVQTNPISSPNNNNSVMNPEDSRRKGGKLSFLYGLFTGVGISSIFAIMITGTKR